DALVRQPGASIDEAAARLAYGGGPGAAGAGLARSRALLRQSAERLWRRRAAWHAAHARRRGCVADLLAAAAA
ncbi:hypothetical protein, partial [Burkholderia pseudomallei]